MNTEPIQVARYDVNEDDVIALQKRVLRSSRLVEDSRRRHLINSAVLWCMFAAIFAGMGYLLAPSHAAGIKKVGLWIVLYVLFTPVFCWRTFSRRAYWKRIDRTIERGVRSGKIPVGRGPAEVLLYEDHLAIVETNSTTTKPWAAVAEVVNEADGVYLRFQDEGQLRVPARAFRSGSELESFVRTARDRADLSTA